MKKIFVLLAVVMMLSLAIVSMANAFTSTGAIAVRAVIQAQTPEMNWTILRTNDGNTDLDPWTNYVTATDLTFDKWEVVQRPGKAAQWGSVTQNYLIVYANGMGDDYQILADGAGSLTGPGGTLPPGSLMCAPIYAEEDLWKIDYNGDGDTTDPGETYAQGAMPAGATKGTDGTIIGLAGKQIYSSESPVGSARIVQILFMFPPYKLDGSLPFTTGYAPIPSTTAAGTYTGATVTVRIAAK